MRRGFIFAGQGAHKKGMGLSVISGTHKTRAAREWQRAETRLREAYNVSITSVIRDNLPFAENVRLPCVESDSTDPYSAPSMSLAPTRIKHPNGIVNLTYLTQPAMLVASVAGFTKLVEDELRAQSAVDVVEENVDLAGAAKVSFFAGHSLGEFSALTAMGIFPLDVAAELVLLRGVMMDHAIVQRPLGLDGRAMPVPRHQLVAVNPRRALLEGGLATLAALVELIGASLAKTQHFVEMVNYNEADQFVVAGTPVALSILGKCVDPQFRAQALERDAADTIEQLVLVAMDSVLRDQEDAIPIDPNTPIAKPVIHGAFGPGTRTSRTLQQPEISMDGGLTLPEEYLSHLTHIHDGRSGLKKKSWFIPINVDVPFHSSMLRRAADNFLPMMLQALPSNELLERRLFSELSSTKWLTNLTGTPFSNNDAFRQDAAATARSRNVGEATHGGRYTAREEALEKLMIHGSTRELLAAVMAAQMAHSVMWSDVMLELLRGGATDVVEISPDPVLSNMLKRTVTAVREGSLDAEQPGLRSAMSPNISCSCSQVLK